MSIKSKVILQGLVIFVIGSLVLRVVIVFIMWGWVPFSEWAYYARAYWLVAEVLWALLIMKTAPEVWKGRMG